MGKIILTLKKGLGLLRGTRTVNLDAKGRFAIPTRYRAQLQASCEGRMMVTVAVDERCVGEKGCLWLYPLAEWEKIESKIDQLPTFNKSATNLRRFLIGSGLDCEMDAQGRLLLPEKLRTWAEIGKKAVLLGQLNKFEIWNDVAWGKKEEEWMNESGDAEGLSELSSLSF